MKVVIFAAFLSLFTTHTFAGCDGFSAQSSSLEITLTECDPEGQRIIFQYIKKGKVQTIEDVHSYPFKEECEYTATGFTCRANGRTPLAGTTWENFKGSNKTNVKPKNWKPSCAPIYYECVKGCQKGIPTEFHGFYEQSYEGECK